MHILGIFFLIFIIVSVESFHATSKVARQRQLAFFSKPDVKSSSKTLNDPKKTVNETALQQNQPSFLERLGFKSNSQQSAAPVTVPKNSISDEKEPSVLDQVASKGLAGVLAIALAEAIFWAAGMPLAAIWYKVTTGEWIDLMSTEGKLQAAGFSFGYGGFATVILQYRVTLFAIPLVPIMEKYVVEPGKRIFGDQSGEKKE